MHSTAPDMSKTTSDSEGLHEQRQAFQAQVAQLYQAGFSALLAMPVAGLILFLALKEELPLYLNVIWLTCIIFLSAIRGILLYAYNMRSDKTPDSTWANYYYVLETLSGLTWGFTGFFLSYVSMEHQLLVFFILIGMVGGASAILAPLYASYVCYAVPALLTFAFFLFQLQNEIYFYMMVLVLLALIIMLNTTRMLTRYIHRTYLLAFENESLSAETLVANNQLREEIDAKERYEDKLHASERQLSNILNNMQDTYYRTNIHGEITMSSPSVMPLLGYLPEELLGTKMANLYANSSEREQFLRKLDDNKGSIINYQTQLRHKQGHLVWVSTNAQYYYDDNGIPQGIEGTTRNVDEIQGYIQQLENSRRDYQRLYEINQNILEHSPIGILFIDKDGRFSYINNNMQQILGVPPSTRHHMLGQRFLDIPSLAKSGLANIAKQLLAGKGQSINIPYTSMYNKSSILAITAVPLQENNHFSGAIVLANDITDKVSKEKQLMDALKKADDANQTKSRFLANVSHELRTPLNAIIGIASLLRRHEDNANTQGSLEVIQHSGENLLSLVNTILTLTQLEQGNYEQQQEIMDLGSYLFSLLRPQIDLADQKNLHFIVENDPDIPHTLMVDKHGLQYTLLPLVDNAVKFTEKGQISFICTLLSQDERQAIIRFQINDTGSGMSEEQQQTMFNYFSIKDDSSSRRHGGLGLGASIARQLIEASGGSIEVHSEIGQGTQIKVVMPFNLVKSH